MKATKKVLGIIVILFATALFFAYNNFASSNSSNFPDVKLVSFYDKNLGVSNYPVISCPAGYNKTSEIYVSSYDYWTGVGLCVNYDYDFSNLKLISASNPSLGARNYPVVNCPASYVKLSQTYVSSYYYWTGVGLCVKNGTVFPNFTLSSLEATTCPDGRATAACPNFYSRISGVDISSRDCWTNLALCSKTCNGNECRKIECKTALDCGNNFFGRLFCSSGNVFSNFTSYSCANPNTAESKCSANIMQVLNKTCSHGCSDGTCIPYCSYDFECGNSSLINNYCSGNNVLSNYSSPSCSNNSCSNNFLQVFNKTCDYKCSEGVCLNRTVCSVNSDCGSESYSNKYCISGNVARNHTIPRCSNNSCFEDIISENVQNCSYGCSDGQCLIPNQCTNNSQCGNSSWINNYCSGNNIMSNYSSPSCENNYCAQNIISVFNQTCLNGCSQGSCVNLQCSNNLDCGEDYYSSNYCLSGDVARNHVVPRCSNNSCFYDLITENVKNCSQGCSNGKCKSKTISSEEDNKNCFGGLCTKSQNNLNSALNLQNNVKSGKVTGKAISLSEPKTTNYTQFVLMGLILVIILAIILLILFFI